MLRALFERSNFFRRYSMRSRDSAHVFLFPDQKVVYIAVPKAGTTSVLHALKDFKGVWDGETPIYQWMGRDHIPVDSLRKVFQTTYKAWTKFTVVRNPYERLLSLHSDKICFDRSFAIKYASRKKRMIGERDLDVVLNNFGDSPWYKRDMHGKPQYRIVGKDLSIYDFVGRVENMGEVFSFLSKVFGKEIAPTHRHQRDRVVSELTEDQKNRIYLLYRPDFKLLGYSRNINEKSARIERPIAKLW